MAYNNQYRQLVRGEVVMAITPSEIDATHWGVAVQIVSAAEGAIDEILREQYRGPMSVISISKSVIDFGELHVVEVLKKTYKGWNIEIRLSDDEDGVLVLVFKSKPEEADKA